MLHILEQSTYQHCLSISVKPPNIIMTFNTIFGADIYYSVPLPPPVMQAVVLLVLSSGEFTHCQYLHSTTFAYSLIVCCFTLLVLILLIMVQSLCNYSGKLTVDQVDLAWVHTAILREVHK